MRLVLAGLLMVACMIAILAAWLFLDEWWKQGRRLEANIGWGALAICAAVGYLALGLHFAGDTSEPPKRQGPR